MTTDKNESLLKKINILTQINQLISRNFELKDALKAVLSILQEQYPINSGFVFLINENTDLMDQIAGIGALRPAFPAKYKIGEGLTGRVAETGKPIIAPRLSKEPLILNREKLLALNKQKDLTYIGIPIKADYKTLGVLVVFLNYKTGRDFEVTRDFFILIGSSLLLSLMAYRVIETEKRKLIDENVALKSKLQEEFGFSKIIGKSHGMQNVLEQVRSVSQSDATVLIRGESGTGKELVAEAIHYNSKRKNNAFITVNCAAIPETLIESEFFGYEKGAFTGADRQKKGRFELADKGTIFLDEIGDLSPITQVKLLRVLQAQEFMRVGGTETIKVNVRVISATNTNLEKAIDENRFREDLYYRINVFSIFLPPLRERRSDILLLADHFMMKYSRRHQKAVTRISTPAIDMLMQYHWPGNVRELENCIERAVLVCEDRVIHGYHLPPTLQTAESSNTISSLSLKDAVASYEKDLIEDALKTSGGNVARAARMLNTTERIIGYKIKCFMINPSRFKKNG